MPAYSTTFSSCTAAELAMNEVHTDTASRLKPRSAHRYGMTGGPESAGEINRAIAQVCDSLGLAFGVGSQRLLTRTPEDVDTVAVRGVAPDVVLFGNVGVNQARDLGVAKVRHLMDVIEADYMAIHLNPAMELAQPGSDADSNFKDGSDTIGRLVDALDGRVLVKNADAALARNGFNVSPESACALSMSAVVVAQAGSRWSVARRGSAQSVGRDIFEWGMPTLAATALASRVTDVHIIASGGVDDGLKVAKAIASGAQVAGLARPVLQAFLRDGVDGARACWRRSSPVAVAMALTVKNQMI